MIVLTATYAGITKIQRISTLPDLIFDNYAQLLGW
jgi:hypothetical protein